MNTAILVLFSLANAVVAWRAFEVIDSMTRQTLHSVRVAWVLVAVGSAGCALGPLFGRQEPSILTTLAVVAGVAILCISDRRKRRQI